VRHLKAVRYTKTNLVQVMLDMEYYKDPWFRWLLYDTDTAISPVFWGVRRHIPGVLGGMR